MKTSYYVSDDGKMLTDNYNDATIFDIKAACKVVTNDSFTGYSLVIHPDISGKWLVIAIDSRHIPGGAYEYR